MTLHHKRISKFSIEGNIYDEAHMERLKREYLALLVLQMKSEGYVIRIDIDPDWTVDYKGPKQGFRFKYTVYGVYVGKKRAQVIDRLDGWKPIYASQRKKDSSPDRKPAR